MQIGRDTGRRIVKLVLILLGIIMLMWGYLLYQSYQGRVDLIHAERQACIRIKLDQKDNALGWRSAEEARLDTLAKNLGISFKAARARLHTKPTPSEVPDLVAARQYNKIAHGLEKRSHISCSKAFPKASFLP